MSEATRDEELLQALQSLDTPTVCNALEICLGGRRATGFTTGHLFCHDPGLLPMVGVARTATIRAVTPSGHSEAETRARRLEYYAYVAEPPGPTVVVQQDLDPEPGIGAFWGEVNTTVHQALGALGVVTNGSVRDLTDAAPGFQMLAGKVGPSHAFVHVESFGCEVNVFGMAVRHGDLIHADRHGAVVLPAEVAAEVPAAAELMRRREAVILEACRGPGFDIEVLRRAMADSADIH